MFRLLTALLLISLSSFTIAEGLHYGVFVEGGSATINDPDGDTGSKSLVTPGIEFGFDLSGRGKRITSGFKFISTEFDAGVDEIGQEVSGYGLFAAYEHRLVLSKTFKPWFGIGAGVNSLTYETRFTVDEDGFLQDVFEDREATEAALLLHIDNQFSLGETLKLGVAPFVEIPLSDGLQVFGVRLSLTN